MTSRCDTICARVPGGDWQCPSAVPLQGGSTLSPQPGAPDSWDCTGNGNRPQGKAQVGTQETFQTCLRDAANKLRGPKDSQSFWEQQNQLWWFRVTQHRNSLCASAVMGSKPCTDPQGSEPCSCHSSRNRGGSVDLLPLQLQSGLQEDLESSTPQKATAKAFPCKSRWILLLRLVHH